MYGSDISNLSRLVKKLFRLYPLSKIVGKRILLRRRIRGNPDLSNLSRLVNAQRRARIGSRTEKSPSISLELRLHPAPPREIGNILKTMSTFPRIILGWVCYWQKYMQKRCSSLLTWKYIWFGWKVFDTIFLIWLIVLFFNFSSRNLKHL